LAFESTLSTAGDEAGAGAGSSSDFK